MERIELDTEAGQIPVELQKLGIAANVRVHVTVEPSAFAELPLAAMAQTGGAFDWLADEPELYNDSDLLPVR